MALPGSSGGNNVYMQNGYMIHVFTASGNFVAAGNGTADVLVVGGGGGGSGGGGGAGGFIYTPNFRINAGINTVTVGLGGAGKNQSGPGLS